MIHEKGEIHNAYKDKNGWVLAIRLTEVEESTHPEGGATAPSLLKVQSWQVFVKAQTIFRVVSKSAVYRDSVLGSLRPRGRTPYNNMEIMMPNEDFYNAHYNVSTADGVMFGGNFDRVSNCLKDDICLIVKKSRHTEHELHKQKIAAEEKLRHYTTYLANNAHDLRSPLSTIIGYSELFIHGIHLFKDEDRTHEYATAIHTSAHYLNSLINDLLDLCRIDADKLELHKESTNVEMLLESAVTVVFEQAEAAGIELAISTNLHVPIVNVDKQRMMQAIINLLSNAIKFSPHGSRVELDARDGAPGNIEIRVKDNGMGIKKEDIPKALMEFGQVGDGQKQNMPSTGLGLPLAKRLTELHGGGLEIQSEYGVGTTVILHIPRNHCGEC